MFGPPDSKNPPTAPAAGAHHDLTWNGPTSADDVDGVPDLRLHPEADSLSTFVPEDAPLERLDSVPPPALTQAPPTRVDIVRPDTYIIWPVHDDDRSWWSRLRSLKASWKTKYLRRSAYDEPVATDADMPAPAVQTGEVTLESIRSLEKHLASLAALRDACASIDRRLARVEEVSRQRDPASIDEALHAVCSQMSDRLVKVEAAAQRTEEAVADKTLHELCKNIDARLGRTEDTLHRREAIVAQGLQEFSARMTARLSETDETIQRIERERVDETLRLTQQSLADSRLPEMCVNIERQLAEARMALQRTEEAVAGNTLHELCANIVERLGRAEDALHRNEVIVSEWLQELSADMTARFAEAEEGIQRIERIVSSRTVEQTSSQQPSVRTDDRLVQAEETAHTTSTRGEAADGGVLARAALVLSRFANIEHMNRPVRQSWMARLAVPVLVLVAVLAIGALIWTSGGVAPDTVVPPTTSDQVMAPVEQATNQGIRAVSTTALIADAPRSTGESRVSAPQQRSPDRRQAPTTSPSPRFVGTLSIASVPSGASVSINGKPAGVTPLRLPRQRAGSLAVQIAHDGFERWSAAVRVPADQHTQVTAKLRATAR